MRPNRAARVTRALRVNPRRPATRPIEGRRFSDDRARWKFLGYLAEGFKLSASMYIPARSKLPVLSELIIEWQGHPFSLPYFYREGSGGPAILFVHGLGGAKENFYWALQSPALADWTLAMFDQPGTGLSEFRPKAELDVSSLAEEFLSLRMP